jgi:high-affinity iron transporter
VGLLLALAAVALSAAPAAAAAAPWQSAQRVSGALADARTELIVATPERAATVAARALRAYAGTLRERIRAVAPQVDRAITRDLRAAVRAARRGDDTALAGARGAVVAGLMRGSFAVIDGALADGDAATAGDWLLLREFRTATRFTRPGTDATSAVRRLAARKLSPAAARAAVRKDLLDAY